MSYTDKNGYLRDSYGDLVHRKIAFEELYEGNEDDYDEPFRDLIVHHIDTDKQNNDPDNLFICSEEDHKKIHDEQKRILKKFKEREEIEEFLVTYESKRQEEIKENLRKEKERRRKKRESRKSKKIKEHQCMICGRLIHNRGNCMACNIKLKKERERGIPIISESYNKPKKSGVKYFLIWNMIIFGLLILIVNIKLYRMGRFLLIFGIILLIVNLIKDRKLEFR